MVYRGEGLIAGISICCTPIIGVTEYHLRGIREHWNGFRFVL